MATSTQTRKPDMARTLLPPTLMLAGQRMRKTWGLLLAVEIGLIGAVLLACVVPLYANIAATVALRNILNTTVQSSSVVISAQSQVLSPTALNAATQALNRELKSTLGAYLGSTQFSLETPNYQAGGQATGKGVELIGTEMGAATTHLALVSGRLPQTARDDLEIALTPEAASFLKVTPGDVIPLRINFADATGNIYAQSLNLRLVGLFKLANKGDIFWNGHDFAPTEANVSALAPNDALVNTLAQLSTQAQKQLHVFTSDPTANWYYHLDTSRITSDNLNDLINGIEKVQIDTTANSNLQQDPYLEPAQNTSPALDALSGLSNRIAVIEFPVISLVVMILGLMLFFIGLMVNLLVDRQSEAIALLRSRGASRRQILGALALQGVIMAGVALLAALLLAPGITHLLTWQTFAGNDQGTLNDLAGPLQVAQEVGLYALLAAAIALAALLVAVWGATRRDILALRREIARSTRKPLWQRLRLDIVAVLIAFVGYGFSVYLLHSNALNDQLYLVLVSPLALLQTVFLLLAGLLILFRLYPLILRVGAKLAAGRRSAAPVLALAQIARAPRQPVRMTLLLALASAFAIFALVFTASQAQRVLDVSSYQAGADFSGTLSQTTYSTPDLSRLTSAYKHLPGVLDASLGIHQTAQAGNTLGIPIDFQAADATTFARAASWSVQDSAQPLNSLIQKLRTPCVTAQLQQCVPAIVDANTLSTLHLSVGTSFILQLPNLSPDRSFVLKIVAEVQHIPTSGNTALPGVLVDYSTFASVYTGDFSALDSTSVALNYVWLHTRGDARSLASLRKALTTGKMLLLPLYDRRAIEAALFADPIYLTLIGELELGALAALLLALLGCLIASWLSVRSRLTNFMALRALGATPRQVINTLSWEQGIIYTAALLLGILFGALFATLSLPSLILTSVLPTQTTGSINNTNFYAAQFVPPLQVIIPPSLWFALGTLIIICLLALGLMVRKVTRSSLSLVLRLNED